MCDITRVRPWTGNKSHCQGERGTKCSVNLLLSAETATVLSMFAQIQLIDDVSPVIAL